MNNLYIIQKLSYKHLLIKLFIQTLLWWLCNINHLKTIFSCDLATFLHEDLSIVDSHCSFVSQSSKILDQVVNIVSNQMLSEICWDRTMNLTSNRVYFSSIEYWRLLFFISNKNDNEPQIKPYNSILQYNNKMFVNLNCSPFAIIH